MGAQHARTAEALRRPLTSEETLEFAAVREAVDYVNDTPLAGLDRAGIEERTARIAGQVRRMVREDYPSRHPHVTQVFRAAYRVLDTPTKPSENDSDWLAWKHLQNLAHSAATLADVLDPPNDQ